MSGRHAWLSFERQGGAPPRDDEALRLAADGSFSARRTIGGLRIGTFEGRLAAAVLARLRALVEALEDTDDVTLPTPGHGATETLMAAGRTLVLGSNETPETPWRPLVEQVRKLLVDEVVDSPLAALELVADAASAKVVHAGSAPIDVDLGSVSMLVVRITADETPADHWRGFAEGRVDNGERLVPTPQWVTAKPGWSAALPYDHGLTLAPGERFQVWVELDVRDAGGKRRAQLYAPVARGR